MAHFRKVTGLPNFTRHYHDVSEPLAKIVFGDEDEVKIERLDKLLHAHPDAEHFDFIRSERTLYEILPKGVSKGTLLVRMAEHLQVPMGRTVAVGDYFNDVSMLRAAGIGVAVENATPEAKAAADRITVSNNEHAIAKTVEEIEKGIIELKLQKA